MQGPVLSLIPIGLIVNQDQSSDQNASESEASVQVHRFGAPNAPAIDRDFKLV